MKKATRIISLIAMLLVVLIITGIVYTNLVKGQQFDRFKVEIEGLQAQLTKTDLPVDVREGVESRLEGVIHQATWMARAYAHWTQEAAGLVTPIPTTKYIPATIDPNSVARIPDGIVDHPLVLRPIPGGFDRNSEITSSWRKTTPNRYFFVYAGYLKDDPKQGMVLSQEADDIWMRQHLTPKKSGALRIVEERDLYLVLKAENGDVYYFDPVRQQFIASLDVPTVTPSGKSLLTTPTPATPYP